MRQRQVDGAWETGLDPNWKPKPRTPPTLRPKDAVRQAKEKISKTKTEGGKK